MMKRGLPVHTAGRQHGKAGRALWAALLPFLAALLIGTALFRSGGGGPEPLEAARRGALETAADRAPVSLGAGDGGLVGSGQADAAAGGGAALPASGGTGAAAAAVAVSGDGGGSSSSSSSSSSTSGAPAADTGERPKIFMFIGILSGRGYRHRRLAVREAWANRAQVPGETVAKFILSEDERTPQVRARAMGAGARRQWRPPRSRKPLAAPATRFPPTRRACTRV